jgi:hypothetical protein
VSVQEPTPAHAPLHPVNVEPPAAVAVNVTLVPASKSAAHAAPQLMAPTLLVIVPAPLPDFETVSVKRGAVGVTAFESADCAPVPTAFFAVTRNV